MVLDGVDWRSAINRHGVCPDIPFIRQQLETYQAQGYTYLRDGGDRWGVGAAARSLASEYGITYRTPLAPLCFRGHYGGFIGTSYEDLREYARLVVQQRRDGADFIKIMISGLMDFHQFGVLTEPGLSPDMIRELIHIAHQEGMAVMAHANGGETVAVAAAAGVDSVEHGAYLNADALAAMAEMGTVWVPTVSTVGNLLGKGRFPDTEVAQILNRTLENLSSYNGLVAAGTDAGAWAVPHGSTTEAAWLAKAGIMQDRLQDGAAVIKRKF